MRNVLVSTLPKKLFPTVLLFTLACNAATTHGKTPLQAEKHFTIAGNLLEQSDISGMACFAPKDQQTVRKCVVIDDESNAPQFATLDTERLTAGEALPLVLPDPPAGGRFGTPPSETCGEVGSFKDLDGEAVAINANSIFVIGSHGCGRSSNKMRASSFLLVRYDYDGQGKLLKVQDSYRLSEVLRFKAKDVQNSSQDESSTFFARKLEGGERGLNIEGLAVLDNRLLVGLRAPSLDGFGYVVETDAAKLFEPNENTPKLNATIHPLMLGAEAGIRDLAALPDGRLLLLAGPTDNTELASMVPATIWLVDNSVSSATKIAELAAAEEGGKAEGLTVLGMQDQLTRVVVTYDSLPGGAPRSFLIKVK